MTRDQAFALAGVLADNGFSCTVGVHVGAQIVENTRAEDYSVHPRATHFDRRALLDLLTIGANNGQDLHLIGDQLSYLPTAEKALS